MTEMHRIKRQFVTQQRLKFLLDYDPETGIFRRKVGIGRAFSGSISGHNTGCGYLSIQLDGVKYVCHRLAWLYVYGEWPKNQIDHINGNKHDNRIANLRDTTPAENTFNQRKARANNKSGFLGVYFKKSRKVFVASVKLNGKSYHAGYFKTAEEAHEAYLSAKRRLHPTCTI